MLRYNQQEREDEIMITTQGENRMFITKEIKEELYQRWDAAKVHGGRFFVEIISGRRAFVLFSDNKQDCWIQSLSGNTTYHRINLRNI